VHKSATSATSRCNGIWEMTQQTQRTFARANLLRTLLGETGVMDFGLYEARAWTTAVGYAYCAFIDENSRAITSVG